MVHAELDNATELDRGNPATFVAGYLSIAERLRDRVGRVVQPVEVDATNWRPLVALGVATR